MRTTDDGGVNVSFSDGSDDLRVSRREFMRISGVAAATAAMAGAGCDAMRNPVEKIVPYVDRPEEVRIGHFNTYATVWNNVGILVKTRTGRPVKLEGNPTHPTSKGGLSAQGQTSYMNLYDPDRARTPLRIKGGGESQEVMTWEELDTEIANKLKEQSSSARVALLTPTLTGSSQEKLIATLKDNLSGFAHYTYDAVNDEALLLANEASYGAREVPHYRFDEADLVVSLQSDFLGTWLSPVEFTRQFASRRNPDEGMSRLVAFEGMLTLTGSNADTRHRVRTSELVYVALGLAHEVIVTTGEGPLASSAQAKSLLAAFTPEKVAERTGLEASVLEELGADLAGKVHKGLVVAGGVASSTPDGVALEAAVNLLNAAIGADGHTIERQRTSRQSGGQYGELKQLVEDIEASKITTLIIAGEINPIYTAPPELGLKEALGKVSTVISCADRVDETAANANYLATSSHFLESWGDALPFAGVYTIQQPVIRPLYETRPFEEALLTWFGSSNLIPEFKQYLGKSEIPPGNHPGGVNFETGAWYRYVREHWKKDVYPKANAVNSFESFWEAVLREGVWVSPDAGNKKAASFKVGPTLKLLPKEVGTKVKREGLKNKELVTFNSIPLGDGRYANNGHLQELPDPITRSTWDSYVMVSPKTFREEGLKNGQIVNLRPSGSEIERPFPVIMVPGMHDDVVAVPLGYGRTRAGDVGSDVGRNAFEFTRQVETDLGGTKAARQVLAGFEVGITPTSEKVDLAIPQGSQVVDLRKRNFLSVTTLDQYKEDKTSGIHKHPPLSDFWEDHNYSLKWGMSVDLSKCTGCNACVIACQEENNIPVVGRQGVIEGREMHWIRVDRYYKVPPVKELMSKRDKVFGDPMYAEEPYVAISEHLDNPRVIFQPMMCQHCENAPCETVCPVLATVHSSDGLNQMAYNRCVGTRYCSNNCPFKVRRFNWYNYSEDRGDEFLARLYPELKEHGRYNVEEPLPKGFNPEVTVRSRGVMEKCTFCVQRIRRAKWKAGKEGRDKMRDGDVITACQQTCPADAITFGNLVDEDSKVYKEHERARSLSPLGEIGVESSVAYLTNVINGPRVDNAGDPSLEHHGHGGGHGDGHGGGHADEHKEDAHKEEAHH